MYYREQLSQCFQQLLVVLDLRLRIAIFFVDWDEMKAQPGEQCCRLGM